MNNINELHTGRELATIFGVSPDTISRWCRDGMPHSGGGRRGTPLQIDPGAALRWLTAKTESRPVSEQQRLASERADAVALQNERSRGELVYAYQLRQAIGRLFERFDECAQVSDGLPERIAGSDDPAEIRAMMLDWTRSLRTRYAEAMATAAHGLD